MPNYYSTTMASPVGNLSLIADDHALLALLWEQDQSLYWHGVATQACPTHAILQLAQHELTQYFQGQLKHFSVPIAFEQGTPFQRQVWQGLRQIPYGQTCSYAQLAQRIARAKAVRAVGAANAKNPISIIVPCHRVIGASGKLVGFAGGVDKKAWLLNHEKQINLL